MNGLNWFQARDLAVAQGHAIRRASWTWWIFKRFNVWLLSDSSTGTEVRRVVQNSDFGDSEFQAKDWTDEPWNGGSVPPCTAVPAANALASNTSGGQAAWTMDPSQCGGDGDGGNIPPISIVTTSPPYVGPALSMHFELASAPGVPLVPDDHTCWLLPPTAGVVLAVVVTPGSVYPPGPARENYVLYIAPQGEDISAAPVSGHYWTVGPYVLASNPGYLQCGFFSAWLNGNPAVYYFGAVNTPNTLNPPVGYGRQPGQDSLVQIRPGDVWHAKLCFSSAVDSTVGIVVASCIMTVPPFCTGSSSSSSSSSESSSSSSESSSSSHTIVDSSSSSSDSTTIIESSSSSSDTGGGGGGGGDGASDSSSSSSSSDDSSSSSMSAIPMLDSSSDSSYSSDDGTGMSSDSSQSSWYGFDTGSSDSSWFDAGYGSSTSSTYG